MEDWQRDTMRWGLGGLGVGAVSSLVLNAIYHAQNGRKPTKELVPNSIINQPFYVDDKEADKLEAEGVRVSPYGMNKAAREILYAQGRCIGDIIKKAGVPAKKAEPTFMDGVLGGAVPMLAGLGAGYAGFRGVDYLMDSMAKDTAKDRYDRKRQELKDLMEKMYGGVSKVAEDYVEGGNLVQNTPKMVKTAIFGIEDLVAKARNFGSEAASGWGKWGVGVPLAIAAMMSFPKALSAFRERNPNREALDDIEGYYRDRPERPQIRLVPTRKRPAAKVKPSAPAVPIKSMQKDEDTLEKAAADAAAAGGASASTVKPDLIPKIDVQKPVRSSPFGGKFQGFTRKGVGNMPMPKNPASRNAGTIGSIGTALA